MGAPGARAAAGARRPPPLNDGLMLHTHNSFNSSAYAPSLTNLDPNQLYTIRDQLRMDIRGVELDLHPALLGNGVVLCHGQVQMIGSIPVHIGCSIDRPLRAGLAEIRAWLRRAGQPQRAAAAVPGEQPRRRPRAHDAAAADLAQSLGPLVIRPPAGQPCAPMPADRTPRLSCSPPAAGYSSSATADPAAWGTLGARARPRWKEAGSDFGDDYPRISRVRGRRQRDGLRARTFIRHYEDSTWLSAMVGGGGQLTTNEAAQHGALRREPRRLRSAHTRRPAPGGNACGAGRRVSRAPPVHCATQGADGRFRADDCTSPLRFACSRSGVHQWRVTTGVGRRRHAARRRVPPSSPARRSPCPHRLRQRQAHGGPRITHRRGSPRVHTHLASWTPAAYN